MFPRLINSEESIVMAGNLVFILSKYNQKAKIYQIMDLSNLKLDPNSEVEYQDITDI